MWQVSRWCFGTCLSLFAEAALLRVLLGRSGHDLRGDMKKAEKQLSDCRKAADDLLPLISETPRLRLGAFSCAMEVRPAVVVYRLVLVVRCLGEFGRLSAHGLCTSRRLGDAGARYGRRIVRFLSQRDANEKRRSSTRQSIKRGSIEMGTTQDRPSETRAFALSPKNMKIKPSWTLPTNDAALLLKT